ncbi:MAG: deoxyribonuclease IV [Ferroplasma sp.]|uniref:deoxyribonuclease IV n=1 Tax=Ferroplasma sp. TaxID=2591003 RepID=UPI00281533F3|nr:deoxyribonuclease IV [Ferroplasma sp.]WMT50986.1 MAG: deoxyribonuclease IV [Ferroplasma sp.]
MKLRCDFESRNKLVGGHVSIAESIALSPERANSFGFNTFQIFVKSNLQWKYREISDEEYENFKHNVMEFKMKKPVVHATYLLNLGSENKELVEKSVNDLKYEIGVCNRLGIEYLVIHPGSNRDRKHAIESIMGIINSMETGNVRILIENSSGKGSTVPATIEEMQSMIDSSKNRTGICLDTCHFFAEGYDLVDKYGESMESLKSSGVMKNIYAMHINDSMFELGSKKDRHENIGNGFIGNAGFKNIINDSSFNGIPMIMETPGGDENYLSNIQKLRDLMVM